MSKENNMEGVYIVIGIPTIICFAIGVISIIIFGFTWNIKILTGAITSFIIGIVLLALINYLDNYNKKK